MTLEEEIEALKKEREAEEKEALDEVAEAVSNKKCILFLGAGVHYPPDPGSPYEAAYPVEVRPPLGKTLSEELAKELAKEEKFQNVFSKESTGNLQRVSLYYEIQKTRAELIKRVRDAVLTDKRPSPVVRGLAKLDFPLICTTNYDQLFEIALRKADKEPFVSSYNKNSNVPTVDYPADVATPKQPF